MKRGIILQEHHLEILRHSVGLDNAKLPYRNGFKATFGHSDALTIEVLVNWGLMEQGRTDGGKSYTDVYYVTEDGFRKLFGKRWKAMKEKAES